MRSLIKCVPSPSTQTQTHNKACCANHQHPESTNATPRRVSPFDPALSASPISGPPHLGLRIRDRPRRQKLLQHRRMPMPRSLMQRSGSTLRCAAALSQAHPLSAQVQRGRTPLGGCLPPPKLVTLCITKPRQGGTEDGARQLPSRQTKMSRKVGVGLADLRRDGKSFEGLLSIPDNEQ